jgi:hypothetical protein
VARALTPRRVQDRRSHDAAHDRELVVGLGEVGGDLGGADRVGRIGDGDGAGEQGVAALPRPAFQGLLRQGVLDHLELGAFGAQTTAKVLQLLDGEAEVVRHHHGARVVEHALERFDGLGLACAIHTDSKISTRPRKRGRR